MPSHTTEHQVGSNTFIDLYWKDGSQLPYAAEIEQDGSVQFVHLHYEGKTVFDYDGAMVFPRCLGEVLSGYGISLDPDVAEDMC